jgi:transcription elongation factor Elf1
MSYRNYLNSLDPEGKFTKEDVKKGIIALHTDYECPFCGKNQSVPQMGGYGGRCIQCGEPSETRP